MRQYLATLHKKSPSHKKRFALMVSGGFTLFVFSLWFVAQNTPEVISTPKEITPIQSLTATVVGSLDKIAESFSELRSRALNSNVRVR